MKKHLMNLKMISLIVTMISLSILGNHLHAQVAQADKDILMDLYNATDGDNWLIKTNWGTDSEVSTWYGVTVINDEIITIDLNENNLNGIIPASLRDLSSLQFLKLDTNQISGSIPVELGDLLALQQLYLGGNQLSGTIPSSLGLLTNLRWLNLSDNLLTGSIPTGLDQLDQLEYLQLSQNNLSGSIPVGLADLANLKWLNLGENQLDGTIPVSLGQLLNLEQLYLNGNQLTGTIPTELGSLTAMKWMNLGQNQLTGGIPSQLGNMSNLSYLYLDGNQLTGSIPVELGLITTLEWLNLGQNQLNGAIPVEIWQLTNLKLIYLNGNQFTGTIPQDISLTDLQWIHLNSNQFSSLPDITAPANLYELFFENNQLTFDDLEYNMEIIPAVSFVYSPQDSIGINQLFTKNIADNFSYTLTTGGTQNNYQWFKDGNILTTQTTATLEINNLSLVDAGKYYCEVTNSLVPGLTITCRKITLAVTDPNETITINFDAGWNIFSSPVIPSDKNLKNILQPLIDAGQLKKVMDEEGHIIEDWGVSNGGWQNTIGEIESTEGYKINVTSSASLDLTGLSTPLPLSILLNTGWNIISWPKLSEQDGLDVFEELISEGTLKKVMDEEGNVIEDWGVSNGGWQNFIGTLKPGEGYKVNVTSASTLTIDHSIIKSAEVLNEKVASAHFIPAFVGKGVDHMNINLINNAESGIKEGDEIGIFDGNICVGSATVTRNSSIINLIASANDGNNQPNGFRTGNEIQLKLFGNEKESTVSIIPLNSGSKKFEKNGTLFASVETDLNTGIVLLENELNVAFYPNPFSQFLNIEVKLLQQEDLTVEIYDLMSCRIRQLHSGIAEGLMRIQWDGNNAEGNRVAPGVYVCRVNGIWKKVIMN